MVKISVGLIIKRAGGIDIAKYNMLSQTLPKDEFELIIVDELYEKRHDVVEEYFKGSGINLVHVNASKENHPKWKPWSWTVPRSMNLALVHATGQLLTICGDYWVYSPTTLECMLAAWEKWGTQGICVNLLYHSTHFLATNPLFKKYAGPRIGSWGKQGGSNNLDAPPATYISTFNKDFNEDPRYVTKEEGDNVRAAICAITREMRDPRPDDPPEISYYHKGEAGRFKYWKAAVCGVWGFIVPVESAVKVNGWNDSFNDKWGAEGEIDSRMKYSDWDNHNYVCSTGAIAHHLPHEQWGADSPRALNKYNMGFEGSDSDLVLDKIRKKDFWADNPFNMAEEREKVKRGEPTLIFSPY